MARKTRAVPRPRPHVKTHQHEILKLLVFLVAVYTLLEMAVPRSVVISVSMQPTLDENQRLLVSRVSYTFGNPHRGDIVVFVAPETEHDDTPLIKHLIGLPGEKIEFRDQSVYINGAKVNEPYIKEPCQPALCPDANWQLKENEYFFMGDNRNHGQDSRAFGPIPGNQLMGRAILKWWSPAVWGFLGYNYSTSSE